VSPEFLITSLIVVLVPGPGIIFTLASGLGRGPRAGVVGAIGCTLGIVPHMAAAIFGLAALLHTSAVAFEIFRYLGVAYLFYLAVNAWREHGALRVEAASGSASALRLIASAILTNLLNPKLSIFFMAFLPQFVRADDLHPVATMLELSAVFMLMTVVAFAAFGLFAGIVRDRVISSPRVLTWMRRSFAAAFVALGAKLAFASR
jgi:threonine/homoserine/homoserine lactone efflux protein